MTATGQTITIGGQEIPVNQQFLEHNKLKFYPENPRIYSIVYNGETEPSQSEIQSRLCVMDHVKQLSQSIKANGGLIDPLIVRDKDFVVLEGNSRLAAYRLLSKNDPIKWGKVLCNILPEDINDDLIFTLLGQYHIIGRKDWSPYEQAGYLWRRHKTYKKNLNNMAKEMGLPLGEVKKLITNYDFMQQHEDLDPQHWSYYIEYLKSRSIKQYRDVDPTFDEQIVNKIRTGHIAAAIDIRNKLEPITKVRGQKGEKLVKKFLSGAATLDECFHQAEESGATNTVYQKLFSFRMKIADPTTKTDIKNMTGEQLKKCKFELKKINEAVGKILNDL